MALGVSADEIVALALDNVGDTWSGSSASFAWGISNLAGLPFFDLNNRTDGPANAPLDTWYESPHDRDNNTWGDGWAPVSIASSSVDNVAAVLKPGDIVRVYENGVYHHGNHGHTFIVVSTDGGHIEVVDDWNGVIAKHDWTDIVDSMADCGSFSGAYVSRIIDDFVDTKVPDTLQGLGYGDWCFIGADLAVAAAPGVTWTGTGLNFTFAYDVRNIGTIDAIASEGGIYLSTDSTITTADTLLTTDDVAALLAGASSHETGSFVLPSGLAAGTYYIGVIADDGGAISELDETNNVSPVISITVASDLKVTSAPTLTWKGTGDFDLAYRVDNAGMIAASAFKSAVYLSTDSTITSADRLLTVDGLDSLAAGSGANRSISFTLPGALTAGTYYIGILADSGGAVTELNETNNISPPKSIFIASDLKVAAPTIVSVGADGTVQYSYKLSNTGMITAGASTSAIYLSTDATITTADILVDTDTAAALLAGASRTETGSFVLPSGIKPGNYYLGVIADSGYAVTELNENNNTSTATPIAVGTPDLKVSSPALAIVWAAAGGTFDFTYKVANIGTYLASASQSGIYLSTDSTITTADRLIAVDDVASLLAGQSRNEGGTFTLPGDVAAGNYYIGVIADYGKHITELGESNNVSAPIRITVVTNGPDVVTATIGEKAWHGLGGNDTMIGTSGRDALYGDAGNDSIVGNGGNDTLIGGAGHDILRGGAGADFFQFDTVADIGISSGNRDIIADWDQTADYIDLRKIDANPSTSGNDAFIFIATEGAAFTGAKGALRWVQDDHAGTSSDRTLIQGDVNGDKVADFTLELSGLHTMRAIDFLL